MVSFVSLSSFIFHEAIHLGSGHRREECVFGVAVTVLSDFERFYVIFFLGRINPRAKEVVTRITESKLTLTAGREQG